MNKAKEQNHIDAASEIIDETFEVAAEDIRENGTPFKKAVNEAFSECVDFINHIISTCEWKGASEECIESLKTMRKIARMNALDPKTIRHSVESLV